MSVCVLTKNDRYYTVTIAVNGGGGGGEHDNNKCLLEIRYPYLIVTTKPTFYLNLNQV